ncbi:MAG: hypothetical protein WBQ09_12975 [Terriglobales bacterium]
MASTRVSNLTKQVIVSTARNFQWNRQMPKWTVMVEGRELPARPLVLEAAGVPPNDPTNSHQAVAILKNQGFVIRYQGKLIQDENNDRPVQPVTAEFIHSLRGCCKGEDSLVEALMRERQNER